MVNSLETRMADQRTYSRFSRRGMTLVELMLVVAIMVVVAALAAPSIQRTLARQSLRSGADRVRIAMGQARVRAIREGEEYAVYYMADGAWFNVAPFSQYQEQSALAARRQRQVDDMSQNDFEDDLLPRGVRFAASETVIDSRAAETMGATGSSDAVKAILFYPDGTSQDARVTLQNEDHSLMRVQLRGLTGIASTVRVTDGPAGQ